MTDLIGHFSALELLWSLIAIAALSSSSINALEAKRDIRALGPIRNGRRRIAIGNLRREVLRIIVNVANLGLGIVAGFIPSTQPPSAVSAIFAFVFIGTSALLATSSFYDRLDRRYLLTFRAMETKVQYEDRVAGVERRGGFRSAQERTATATERIADQNEQQAEVTEVENDASASRGTRLRSAQERTASATERIADTAEAPKD